MSMAFPFRWLLILVAYASFCLSEEIFNSSLLSQYDKMVCDNEPSCSLINHYSIPDDRRSLDRRNCMCDLECPTYRDCCYDSTSYKKHEQLQAQVFYCPPTINVYMKTNCPADWPHHDIARLCEKSMEPLNGDDLLLILPVTNNRTAITYGNMYCAMCHDDAYFEPWTMEPSCTVIESAIPFNPHPLAMFYNRNQSPLSLALYLELYPSMHPYIVTDSTGKAILDVYLYQEIDGRNRAFVRTPYKVSAFAPQGYLPPPLPIRRRRNLPPPTTIDGNPYDSHEVWKYVRYDANQKQFMSTYDGRNFACNVGPKLPDRLKKLTRTCIPKLIDSCPPGSDPVHIQYCREFTSIVYNKYSRKSYRNKYCAYCNNELQTYLTGCIEKAPEYDKNFQITSNALSGGINPCTRSGAKRELSCAVS